MTGVQTCALPIWAHAVAPRRDLDGRGDRGGVRERRDLRRSGDRGTLAVPARRGAGRSAGAREGRIRDASAQAGGAAWRDRAVRAGDAIRATPDPPDHHGDRLGFRGTRAPWSSHSDPLSTAWRGGTRAGFIGRDGEPARRPVRLVRAAALLPAFGA